MIRQVSDIPPSNRLIFDEVILFIDRNALARLFNVPLLTFILSSSDILNSEIRVFAIFGKLAFKFFGVSCNLCLFPLMVFLMRGGNVKEYSLGVVFGIMAFERVVRKRESEGYGILSFFGFHFGVNLETEFINRICLLFRILFLFGNYVLNFVLKLNFAMKSRNLFSILKVYK